MSNFIFNAAAAALTAATLDLSTGNYYAHLVTTTPQLTDSTVANLVLPTISGYVPTVLTGLNDNGQRWTFDNFTFPRYVFAATPPVGVVICKRSGASPAASDQVICYSDFLNSIGQVILSPVGAYLISLSFGASGAIDRTYRYQYSSGAYVAGANAGFPPGLIYLLGTDNNTIGFSNPVPAKIAAISSDGANYQDTRTNRNASSPSFCGYQAFDFGAKTVRVGELRYLLFDDNGGTAGSIANNPIVTISGSNYLTNFDQANILNNSNWTVLATVSANINTTGAGQWIPANSTNNTNWRYIKWQSSSPVVLMEIELYNSSILSPSQNLV
jgi:hypothetical protein